MAEVAQVGASGRALAVVDKARVTYASMPKGRRNWLTGALVGMVAVVLAAGWYAGRPDWRVLFSGLEGRDVQQVSQELGAAGIPFQSTADGSGVEVPAESLDKARMEVAAKGMPASGRLGFELFDKPNWVGSEFEERVNYQRALEGELEHTIGTLGAVRSARVHLVLPQESLFATEAKVAKASVVMKLKRGLGEAEADSIRNLVAGAVENLQAEQVTLVDADGRVNLQAKGRGASEGDAAQALEAKLIAMLEPLAGAGNVRATVNVSYEQGSEERTDEIYDPLGSVALSTTKSEQVSAGGSHAQGVPGTASNTPAAAPVGAVQGSATAAAPGLPPLLEKTQLPVYPGLGGQNQTKKEESGTFAVSKHFVHRESGAGQVRRVTTAVVVNDKVAGPGLWKPRTGDEMHRLEGLAKAAVGFDEKRGDEVVMENVAFSGNVPEVKAAGAAQMMDQAKGLMASQPGLLKTAMLGVLGVMVVLLVLRPVAGQVVATLREPALLSETKTHEVRELSAGEKVQSLSEMKVEAALPAPVRMKVRTGAGAAVYDQVSAHIKREPGQSTRLLEAWISADEEAI